MIPAKIREKLTSLLNVTVENGASENEANMALKVAAKLMSEYNLAAENVLQENVKEYITLTRSYGNYNWLASLYNTFAINNGVLCLKSSRSDYDLILFGPHEKIQIVIELFDYAFSICKNYGKDKFKGKRTSFRYKFWTSYGFGFANGVAEIYKEQVNETNTTAIVLDIQARLKEQYGGVIRGKPTRYKVTNDYSAGYATGSNLRKPLTDKNVGGVKLLA